MSACLVVFVLGIQTNSAQFTITIPKIPTITKSTPEPSKSSRPGAAYDKDAFNAVKWGNTQYIVPYLECYAKKYNLDVYSVTGDAFSPPGFDNAQRAREYLEAELPKLAEIETLLKNKMASRPNTGKNFHENPAIWDEISTGRTEYLKCAVEEKGSRAASESGWLRAHLEMIQKMQTEVDSYTPDRNYFVTGTNSNYLLFAVSQRERANWIKGDTLEFKPNLDPVLDALAASAAKKLPLYKSNAVYYKFRDPTAEKILMNYFKNPATIKVHRIGLASADWEIQKDNYDLLPSYRYKYANVYYRDLSDDHPYCRIASAMIKQDYAGGGRFNTQMYRSSADVALVGCPSGQ